MAMGLDEPQHCSSDFWTFGWPGVGEPDPTGNGLVGGSDRRRASGSNSISDRGASSLHDGRKPVEPSNPRVIALQEGHGMGQRLPCLRSTVGVGLPGDDGYLPLKPVAANG